MNPPDFRLDERIALVTGAASGIGRGIALGLAASGADVAPSIRAKTSSASRGARSTTRPVTERRIPSARIRMRSREPISSSLAVATSRTGWMSTWWAR